MIKRQVLDRLARARLEIDAVAMVLSQEEFGPDSGTIRRDLKEAKARVDALEARVQVLEARSAI